MATRRDVAKEAGVSEATVSHVINNTKYVSPELKKRVLQAIDKLDYCPSPIAQSMVTKKSKHVAILVNDLKNPRYAGIAEAMQNEAAKYGYIVSLIDFQSFGIRHERVAQMISRNLDGIFVATYVDKLAGALKVAMSSGIKIICAGDGFGTILNTDYADAIDDMVRDLVSQGHTRIAYLSGYSVKETRHSKFQAYVDALHHNGLAYDSNLVVDYNPTQEVSFKTGYESMRILLERGTEVTAVFAVNDLAAVGAMKAIREYGLRIPEDISVVGCDNIELCDYVTPMLSTIEVPKEDMGRKAMQMLLRLIKGVDVKDMWITATYFKRDSTGIAKIHEKK